MDSGAPPPGPSTPPAEEWQAHWARTLPQLQRLSGQLGSGTGDVSVMRSSQLDAARLDEELSGMLREQFLKAFALFQPGVIAYLQAELALLLDLLIFWFSIRQGKPLPGMALMNLRYRNERAVLASASCSQAPGPAEACAAAGAPSFESMPQQLLGTPPAPPDPSASALAAAAAGGGRTGVEGPGLAAWQRWCYCLGAVVLKYGWARAAHLAAARHWGDAAQGSWRRASWALLRRTESGYRAAAVINLLAFLRTGRYRSLLERLLSARLVYARPSAARAISFEYLNRQLVWAELSELLLFLLPLLDVEGLKRALRARLPRLPALRAGPAAAAAAGGGTPGAEGGARGAEAEAEAPCGICGAPGVLSPWLARPCGHLFCYYCLRSHTLADAGYTCPVCLARVEAMQRHVGRELAPGEGGLVDSGGRRERGRRR